MKHFTLILAAAITAVSASAMTAPAKHTVVANPHKMAKPAEQSRQAHATALTPVKKIDLSQLSGARHTASRAESGYIDYAEGEAKQYTHINGGFTLFWGMYVYYDPEMVGQTEIVWGADGDVYIKDIISDVGFGTYVKGTYADGEITIQFPQCIYADEDGYEYNLTVCEFDSENMTYLNATADKCTVKYTVNDDGSLSMKLNPGYEYVEDEEVYPQYIIGLVGDTTAGANEWYGYGLESSELELFTDVEVTCPETAVSEKWLLSTSDESGNLVAYFCNVAIDGDDIYVQGFSDGYPEGWAKGTIQGDKVYFESGQYQGYSEDYGTTLYFLTGKISTVLIESDDPDEEPWEDFHVEFTDGMTFAYDAEARTLTAEAEDDCFVINANKVSLYYLTIGVEPEIFWQDPVLMNADPEAPVFVDYMAYDPDFYGGQGYFAFELIPYNVNGYVLDTNRMYYSIFVDGEVYGLDPDEYPYVDEYMEMIPFGYTDGYDIEIWNNERVLYFYFDGAESLGVQSYYVGTDDVVYASEIMTYVPEVDGISDVVVPVQVLSTKYFDLAGREVSNPQAGIYIKSMRLANGTVRNVKVMVK